MIEIMINNLIYLLGLQFSTISADTSCLHSSRKTFVSRPLSACRIRNSSSNIKVTKRVENSNIDTNLPKMRAKESNIINETTNNLRENKVSLQALKKENRVRDQQIQKQKPPSDGGRKMKSKGNTLTFPKILESFNNK